jgi:restriction system protein
MITTLWGIHANPSIDARDLFRQRVVVAIGWDGLGDLTRIKATRAAFKEAVRRDFPGAKPGAVPVVAGVLYRFVHEMQPGDWVLYPSKHDRHVNIGKIDGAYRHDPGFDAYNPNVRPVVWQTSVPRTHFSQGALYEIGSALTLFQVRNFADEFLRAAGPKATSAGAAPDRDAGARPAPPEDDGTVANVVAQIEENTRDFVLKTLAAHHKGHGLAELVGQLLGCMGYRTRVSPPGPDHGVDVLAHRDALGFEPPIIKVQVKSQEQNVGEPEVAALYGKVDQKDEYGLFVTMGGYTRQALDFARSKSNLRLIDGQELVDMLLEHYERFDPGTKAQLPLKRLYVPDPPGDDAGAAEV